MRLYVKRLLLIDGENPHQSETMCIGKNSSIYALLPESTYN
jgi:hypothetical protein